MVCIIYINQWKQELHSDGTMPFAVNIPQFDTKSLRASIVLKLCMVERLKWARASAPGVDSYLIGAKQAASAYLYNYVIWEVGQRNNNKRKCRFSIRIHRFKKVDCNQLVVWCTCCVHLLWAPYLRRHVWKKKKRKKTQPTIYIIIICCCFSSLAKKHFIHLQKSPAGMLHQN